MNKDDDIEIFVGRDAIGEAKKELASDSREQLIRRINTSQPSDRHCTAARILLAEMDARDSEIKHKEVITETRRSSNFAKWAVIVGILSLLAFSIDFAYRYFHSKDESKKHTEEQETKPKQQQSSKAISEPRNDQTHKQPLKPKLTTK